MGFQVFPASGATTMRIADFTTSGTWVCPANVYAVEALVVGAGGGGGSGRTWTVSYAVVGGGGGGGSVKRQTIPVTPGATYAITVGAAGAGATTEAAGGNGGYSEISLSGSTIIRAYGGGGGGSAYHNGTNGTYYTASYVGGKFAGLGGSPSLGTGGFVAGSGGNSGNVTITRPTDWAYDAASSEVFGAEGSGKARTPDSESKIPTLSSGLAGVDGFGSGGSAGVYVSSWNATAYTEPHAPYGAGQGGNKLGSGSAVINGGSATVAGCGGGGGCNVTTSSTRANGGDGANGLVRLVYFA